MLIWLIFIMIIQINGYHVPYFGHCNLNTDCISSCCHETYHICAYSECMHTFYINIAMTIFIFVAFIVLALLILALVYCKAGQLSREHNITTNCMKVAALIRDNDCSVSISGLGDSVGTKSSRREPSEVGLLSKAYKEKNK